ncbi:hypothetical protein N4P33_12820 [Streptomyces sp. 15-116A]|uniref:hypothetical protein n=1 Tax=Streptomyces sp. 15-116A TaxID=2259035 RepID=UPI0021B354D5|nr:hypothetical protein [Streptomyces sp. 15-116A]MCT7353050.1 hypothetical protein [Streptomyces sp. 15-116A]
MTEWGVGLIAAGSALLGSLVTGWFTRSAGRRQAEAARHAGDRQADAVLDTVRMTLEEQRATRLLDGRRQAYVRFLEAAEATALTLRTGEGQPADRSQLHRALAAVLLEGPPETACAAGELVTRLRGSYTVDEVDEARRAFVEEAQKALAA